MNDGIPTKPPRGVKHYKEPSGLLMSVIRTLSTSETDEQRDKEKGKLEKDYKKSNARLEELVSLHDKELTQVMQLFVKVSSYITSSREKIRTVKNNLQTCKTLLKCKRDELERLWLEGIEHKHSLRLLEEIDQLREVPSQLAIFLSNKQYLHATQLLMSALSLGNGNLDGVEALREVRSELQSKKQLIYGKLLEELKQYLYVIPCSSVMPFRRQGSGRDNLLSPFQRTGDSRGSNRSSRAKRKLFEISARIGAGESDTDYQNKQDEADDFDAEDRYEKITAVIVECLALLQKVPDAIEIIKVQMQSQLMTVVNKITSNILEESQNMSTISINPEITRNNETEPKRPLLQLLETVFELFRKIVSAHAIVLGNFNKILEKNRIDIRLYEMPDVWSKIQTVLQHLLTDYLDLGSINGDPLQPPAYSEPATDISSYFSKRKPQRQKRVHLFRFDHSFNSFEFSPYVKEQVGQNLKEKEKQLVCSPDMYNVTVIFIPLRRFIHEIEEALNSSPCTLNTFLMDYVRDVFIKRLHFKVSSTIDSTTKAQDAWKSITDPDTTKKMGLTRPLLQSTVTAEKCISELRELIRTLPAFADRFVSIIYNILRNYRETCQAAYRGIVQPDSEDKRICSAAWLKDDDISRFIKSLPNWTELQAYKPTHRRGKTIRREETGEEESPEDIRQRNVKEAEILASNMGEAGISAHEILSNVGQLKKLAQLHESMEWFAAQVLQVIRDIKEVNADMSESFKSSVSESAIQSLYQLVHEFTELADICLLVDHVVLTMKTNAYRANTIISEIYAIKDPAYSLSSEDNQLYEVGLVWAAADQITSYFFVPGLKSWRIRVQCFHYLLPKTDGTSKKYNFLYQEPDPNVQELSRVLINVDEAMVSSLQPRKTKYIFEGLGHLIAKFLISSSQYMEQIDEGGIQRMCRNVFALQQTLTNITSSREVALDHAKQFFEMFYQTPDEILGAVLDKGPQFTDMEYMNAFQLLHRTNPAKYANINNYLQRLSDILGEIGVTV